jgi:hypothetical protein
MISYPQFHDGQLEGLWLDGDRLHVFLSTEEKTHFVLTLVGVTELTAGDFSKQNVIFGIQIKDHNEVTLQDVRDMYAINPILGDESRESTLLGNIQEKELVYLIVDPSCGANCLALAKSAELYPRHRWIERFLL